MQFDALTPDLERPEPWAHAPPEFWTHPHSAQRLLETHLDPAHAPPAAARKRSGALRNG